jgi:uncharacterized membrane protein YhaH (DUF805 family)
VTALYFIDHETKIKILKDIYILTVFLPTLGVTARRLHDIGRKGWEMLVVIVPFIGIIWLLALMTNNSDPGENKFGPNPKQIAI